MINDIQKILADQLRQIDAEVARLKSEKDKVKQALAIFKAAPAPVTYSGAAGGESHSTNEPIFKDKVRQALKTQFPQGATARELLEYINENWTRQIKRASLSPQLSRLRQEGVITVNGGVWKLATTGEDNLPPMDWLPQSNMPNPR